MEEVPVGRVDLHRIRTGLDRAGGRSPELVDDAGDLRRLQGAGAGVSCIPVGVGIRCPAETADGPTGRRWCGVLSG